MSKPLAEAGSIVESRRRAKIVSVFGTRPEAIKMCPLVRALAADDRFESRVLVTAQHRDMLDAVLRVFAVTPDLDLNLMRAGQSIADVAAGALRGVYDALVVERPDMVLVHGDTSTALAAAQAAFYLKIPVGHVEAGLRSGDLMSPFPEEYNRRGIGLLASLHLAPTSQNVANLRREGVAAERIVQTGNTVIDALKSVIDPAFVFDEPWLNTRTHARRLLVLTCHRRENFGAPMQQIFRAVRAVADTHADVDIVFPVHPNPNVRTLVDAELRSHPQIHLIDPLDYVPFANLLSRAYLVLTDSGGIQEEAPALGKPVVVLRTETERPEAVAAGTVVMAGVAYDDVVRITNRLLDDANDYRAMARAVNPYGDGTACARSVAAIAAYLA